MTKPLTDEEIAQLEKDHAAPAGGALTDDDIAAMEAKETPRPRPKTPMLESVISGGAQGITANLADEATAGVGAIKDWITRKDVDFRDIPEVYDSWKRVIQKKDDEARRDNPGTYQTAEVGGALLSSFLPVTKALNAPKGAKLVTGMKYGAAGGALSGFGESRTDDGKHMFDSLDNLTDTLGDTALGGAVGAAVPVGLKAGGKVLTGLKNAPGKVASVFAGVPEEAVNLYMKGRDAVNNAPARHEIVRRTQDVLERLKRQVMEGSGESRKILRDEGNTVSGDTIAGILESKAEAIRSRSEGVIDNPQQLAALKWLEETAEKYRSQAVPDVGIGPGTPKPLSTNRAKDFLQTIDNTAEHEIAPGRFGRIDDGVKKDVRHDVDTILKDRSPAYRDQMTEVSADTGLLNEASELAGSPQGWDGLLKRVQRERAFFPAETLGKLDDRMGSTILPDLKLSMAKEAFDKSATNGSRNVNLYKEWGRELGEKTKIPFAGSIGATVGATVDKHGPKLAKMGMDAVIDLQEKMASSQNLQKLGKFSQPLMEAAKRGNNSLAVTHFLLLQDPEYEKLYQELDSEQ